MRPNVYKFVGEVLAAIPLLPKVVEFGSYQVGSDPKLKDLVLPRIHERTAVGPPYLGVDMREGPNVDKVDDMETLSYWDPDYENVGLVLCCETLEHVTRPWRALKRIRKILSYSGDGVVVVTVPFTFGIHAHPNDYYRFTAEGLKALFDHAGFDCFEVGQDPAEGIWPHTAVGVASVGRLSDEIKAVVRGGSWRQGGMHLVSTPLGKPTLVAGFENEQEMKEFEEGFARWGGVWPPRPENMC